MSSSMPDSYFAAMYESDPDPWGFDVLFYEQRKYDLTIGALSRPHYQRAFEPGCANGALTERLARRCNEVWACDIVVGCVERATRRLAPLDHVSISRQRFPEWWPPGRFDLIVWSEIAYYCSSSRLSSALDDVADRLTATGELVVVNYTGATNYPLTADEVDETISDDGRFDRRCSLRAQEFRLDLWTLAS